MEHIEAILPSLMIPVSYLVLYLVIFTGGKYLFSLIIRYSMYKEVSENQNSAVSIAYAGFLTGLTIVYIGALTGPTQGYVTDMINVTLYSVLGVFLLLISRLINDKLILSQFNNREELIRDKNDGTGAVLFGSYIASGLVVAGAIHGQGGGIDTAIAFFALSQIALVIFTRIYDFITPYRIHDEIENDNRAVGVAFGGTLIALGVLLMNGASGAFISWEVNLEKFAFYSIGAFVILPVFRIFMDKILIPQYDLSKALSSDKNLGAGILEAIMVICFSIVLSAAL